MWLFTCSLVVLAATSRVPPDPAAPGGPEGYPNLEAVRHYAAGRLLQEEGQPAAALSELFRAMSADPDAWSLALRASEVAAQAGQPERSLELAERVLRADSTVARAHWLRGAALFNLERPAEALAPLERAADLEPGQPEYQRTLAHVAEDQDRWDLSARAFRRVLDEDEEDPEAWFQYGSSLARLGRFAAADSALDRSAEMNPHRPGMDFIRALVSESLGRPGEAIDQFREHLRAHPDDLMTRRRVVELLARSKRWKEAWEEARRVSKATADDAEAVEIEGDLAFRAGRAADGMAAVDRLEHGSAADPGRLDRVIRVLSANGRAKDAAVRVEKWAARHPGERQGMLLAARARAQARDYPRAEAHARRAVAAEPDSIEPRALLARIQGSAGRWPAAESTWVEVLRRHPGHSPSALSLAFAREQQGDLAGAESAVRDVLRRTPEDATALNFLGYMFADRNVRLDEALELVRKAVDIDPDNGAFIDSLGWVYFRLGRLEEARSQLERAVQLTEGDPEVHEHLGDVYKAMSLMDLARQQYRIALASDPANPRVKGKLGDLP